MDGEREIKLLRVSLTAARKEVSTERAADGRSGQPSSRCDKVALDSMSSM